MTAMRVRHAMRLAASVVAYFGRTGRWWTIWLVAFLLAIAAFTSAVAVTVPTATYVLF